MQTSLWLTYDLGARGDYEGLYAWLANHGAKECGTSVAFLENYQYEGDLVTFLKQEISEAVEVGKRSRMYALFRNDDGRVQGKFVFGHRKSPPWAGFGDVAEEAFDEAS